MERRGTQFLDDTIRVSRLSILKDRDRFKTAFADQVGSGADRRIEERAGEAVDELLRATLTLWNEAYARLAERQKDGNRLAGAALTYDRDAALRAALKEAKLQRERYDIDAEARRILEAARSTAALFAGTQAAAVGLGALTTVLLTVSAVDVTGGLLAAGALAAAGFWLLPRQRRKAKAEFRERVEELRTALRTGLSRQLTAETGRPARPRPRPHRASRRRHGNGSRPARRRRPAARHARRRNRSHRARRRKGLRRAGAVIPSPSAVWTGGGSGGGRRCRLLFRPTLHPSPHPCCYRMMLKPVSRLKRGPSFESATDAFSGNWSWS